MGVTSSTSRKGMTEVEPGWIKNLTVTPECAGDQMGSMSDGLQATGQCSVMRTRRGHFDTDGVMWSRGFTSGKHVFEIHFPMGCRGLQSSVGVGTPDAPVYFKGKVGLVGHNKESWGVNLSTKRASHRGQIVKKFPFTTESMPDKFYMYLDADSGVLQFGTDFDYYGTALGGIPRSQPLHPMASCMVQDANIAIIYKGQGSFAPVVQVLYQPPPPMPPPMPAVYPPPPAYMYPPPQGAEESKQQPEPEVASAPLPAPEESKPQPEPEGATAPPAAEESNPAEEKKEPIG